MTKFERLFHVMTRPWVVFLCVALIVFSFLTIDRPLAIFIEHLDFKQFQPWLNALTHLGLGMFYIIALAIVGLGSRFILHNKRWEERAWFLWLCVAIPSVICFVLKIIFGRARPDMLFSQNLYGFYGPHKSSMYWSFPSGHTTTIMGLMFGLSALFPRYCVGFVFSGSLIALSRILLTQHYVSDVLFASYLALLEVGLLYGVWKYRNND